MMKPYLSNETRERAKMALDDLSTEQLLAVIRQTPVPDYRVKEVDMSLAKDLATHRKTFQIEKPQREAKEPRDPAELLKAMSYAKVPNSPGMQQTGQGPRSQEIPVMEGDPLGPMRAERPKLEKPELPVYEGFRMQRPENTPDEGGGSNNAST